MKKINNHIVRYDGYITKQKRNTLNQHDSGVIWFTGLSASGKPTIAHSVEKILYERNIHTYVFDGDNIRHGLNVNLGFNDEDRLENLRRIVEVAKLFVDAGIVVLAAFSTRLIEYQRFIRNEFAGKKFLEIYIKCDIEECLRRDPKGLYLKAKSGEIKNYTGISAPFEEPENPELVIDTQNLSLKECITQVLKYLDKNKFLQVD